jgi:hypothetical protein
LRKLLTIILTVWAVLFSACAKNPFSTRGTEPPIGSGGTWETPHSPEAVIGNLFNAYNERVISNYELCFSDSFQFSSPEDSIDAAASGRPFLFTDWNKAAEVGSTRSIFITFSTNDTMKLFLFLFPSLDHSDQEDTTVATLYRTYSLKIILTHAGIPDTSVAEGLATFHLVQEALNWWTIRWWEDLPVRSGALDWGDFKAEYRQ